MKLGIMQPYLFPYIGYFSLIKAVDKYVVYDDVNYIKKGWINRNNILVNGKSNLFSISLLQASQNKLINEIEIGYDFNSFLKMIHHSYSKAPFFAEAFSVIENIVGYEDKNLASFITNSLVKISEYLKIDTEFIVSSKIEKENDLRGQEKILHICKILGATDYYNAIGGQELYSKEKFCEEGINLHFLKSNTAEYKQFDNEFVPNLSILDVMMFNSSEEINGMLDNFELT